MYDERLSWLRWLLVPGLGLRRCHQLLNLIDHPEDLFKQPNRWPLPDSVKAQLQAMNQLGEQHPIHRRALAELHWSEQKHCHLISFQCLNYPSLLSQIPDSPLLLWVAGNAELLSQPQVAMVGSRNASLSARKNAQRLAGEFASAGKIITSGGAAGIDACVHEAALSVGGNTLAVLGSGVDITYPKQHHTLFERISQQGALVSEYPRGTQPKAGHFPRRNRIISGLCDALVVVEAAEGSGSLITTKHALEQGRDIYAIPGDINNPNATGCHQLIKEGAYLLDSSQDLLGAFQPSYSPAKPTTPADDHLSAQQQQLLALLGSEPQPLDLLADALHHAPHDLLASLLELELSGWIQQQPGGYSRLM